MQEDLRNATLMVAPVMGLLVFGVGWLLGNRALRPVAALSAAAERIDASNPEARLPLLDASSEIAAMTEVLNRSFDRLQRAYASAARFSADASHQLRTPLAVMRAGLDGLMAQPGLPAGVAVELEGLMKQTRRLTTLTSDLLLLAQIDAGRLKLEPAVIDLAELGRAVVDDLEVQAGARGLEVVSELPEVLPALGDARRVAIILQNLGENAVKYADGVSVRVANTGAAIPEEHRAHLFDRFYRAASGEDVKGHGLGLNIARGLARAQDGELELVRSDGEWTEFVLRLPSVESVVLG
jgi:signal transduction histidine kinase